MGDADLPKEHLVIAFFQPLPEAVKEWIRQTFPGVELTAEVLQRAEPVPTETARKATLLVTFDNLPNPKDAPNLKLIHFLSAGLDHSLNHPIIKDSRVTVSTSSGIHGPPITEWTVMNWLVASCKFIATHEDQKAHRWGRGIDQFESIHDQVGKKVGILGYGSLGRQIARVATALGMSVYAYTASPRLTPESRVDTGYVVPGMGDKEGTLPVSWHHGTDKASIHKFLSLGLDHLVVCLPLTPQTRYLLGAEEFALLAKSAPPLHPKPFLMNVARGKVLDQDALIAALRSGELSGAALDVTDPEPLPEDHPLWDALNVQISPHVSSLNMGYFARSLDVLRENLAWLERGEELVNLYKRGKGY